MTISEKVGFFSMPYFARNQILEVRGKMQLAAAIEKLVSIIPLPS